MTAKERIIQFIDLQKVSNRKFSSKIGVSHVYFSKSNAMGTDVLEKIFIAYPELNMDWVITGRGEMLIDLNILAETGGLDKVKNKFKVKDSQEMITHELVELKAMLRMVLRVDSELLSTARNEPNTKTINQISEGVADEISTAFAEIERKYG